MSQNGPDIPEDSEKWVKMRMEYKEGGITCKQLAKKYGCSPAAVSARCLREQWRARRPIVVDRAEKRVEKAIFDKMMTKSEAWVSKTVERMEERRRNIDASVEQMQPAMDPALLVSVCRAEAVVDEVARRSLGLRDQPQELVVGTVELQSQMLAELQSLRQLQAEGKIIDCVPDVEKMKRAKIVPD